jgi:hypothetical protein
MTVTAVRLYEAMELIFPEGALMPTPNATAAVPPCLCCQRLSPFPPGKLGWLTANGDEALFLVCGPCADVLGPDLKQKLLDKFGLQPEATVTAIAAE